MKYSKFLSTPHILDQYKPKELITLECDHCNISFTRSKKHIYDSISYHNKKFAFCSLSCSTKHQNKQKGYGKQLVICKQCNKKYYKLINQIKRSKNHFCSHSCSAIYNNTHKTHGTRVSKLEVWLQEQLITLYPNLEFKFNSKEEIQSELDIYIPSLQLAFELNGIFHYEPIFGKDKLNQIQNNDQRKFGACIDNNIALCTIDTQSQKKFTPQSSQKFLDIILNIIQETQCSRSEERSHLLQN